MRGIFSWIYDPTRFWIWLVPQASEGGDVGMPDMRLQEIPGEQSIPTRSLDPSVQLPMPSLSIRHLQNQRRTQ